ncbi:MAG: hypothetical protein H6636_09985 [Anaerolineales bacterium]|nr:hypothetical protein [Anaerolineales bacterium]
MITKSNLYNWLVTISQPQMIRVVLFVLVFIASGIRIAAPPTLACTDLSCGGHAGG